jgi:hypothetical protein
MVLLLIISNCLINGDFAMTISKKLALFIPLALGIQFAAQAYNVNELTSQTESILKFAQNLRKLTISDAQNIAQWLDAKVMDQYYVHNDDIITIANIINSAELTTESKLTIFCKKMQKEATDKRNEIISNIAAGACFITIMAAIMGSMVFLTKMHKPMYQQEITFTRALADGSTLITLNGQTISLIKK